MDIPKLCENLLHWFYVVKEDYSFRKNRTPYRVWVSEVVLQQTRISAALPKLESFLSKFPEIVDLAKASEEEVLSAFQGLGYYSRARNLKKGAEYMLQYHDGKVPADYKSLLKVPSIGSYTASAIASICFGIRQPVVDGNVQRVLARVFGLKEMFHSLDLNNRCTKILQKWFSQTSFPPGDWNEAIMELGQKICARSSPCCLLCPISHECWAFKHNKTNEFPIVPIKEKGLLVDWHVYIFHNKYGEILLQYWPNFYFLKGQQALPSTLYFPTQQSTRCSLWILSNIDAVRQNKVAEHSITSHKITLYAHIIKWPPPLDTLFYNQDGMYNGERARIFLGFQNGTGKMENCFWWPKEKILEKIVSSAFVKVWEKYSKSIR